MSIGKSLVVRPARDHAEAVARFAELAARDDANVIPEGRSRFLTAGRAAPLAVVLLHGYTNVPEQWMPFAEQLRERGHNVVIPRFPGHGIRGRSAKALAGVRADDFLRAASAAVDVATGAGERVVLAGLSIGGAMAAWLALRRNDVTRAVPIVPLFGVARLNAPANRALAFALGALPDFIVPWDPRGSTADSPPYAYGEYSTRTLGQCLDIGLDVARSARSAVPNGTTTMIVNVNEPACNNALACDVATAFVRRRDGSCDVDVIDGLPANHDIIDRNNPQQRTSVVYPRVLAAIERSG